MMKKWFRFLGVLTAALMFTACFEIKQKVDVKNDGSGQYTMTFDLGEIGEMLKAEAQKDGEEFSLMSSSDEFDFASEVEKLNQIDGISNARSWETEDYTVNVSFDFEDFDALNRGARVVFTDSLTNMDEVNVFSAGRGNVTFNGYDLLMGQVKKGLQAEGDSLEDLMRMMFQDLTMTTEMTFAKEVESVDNNRVLLNANRKGVVLRHRPFRKEEEDQRTAFTVELD